MTDEKDNPVHTKDSGLAPGPVWCFTLIMAEVIFGCELGIQSRRTQFISKSDGGVFPRNRLVQLQKMAASTVVNEVKQQSNGAVKKVEVEAVYLLGTIDCGWMTEEEFLESGDMPVATDETPAGDTAAPAEGNDNVVQLRPE